MVKAPGISVAALLILSASFCPNAATAQLHISSTKQPVRVLFVRRTVEPEADASDSRVKAVRAEDFLQFLEKNFTSVKTVKDRDFRPQIANDVDVIVVDGDIL